MKYKPIIPRTPEEKRLTELLKHVDMKQARKQWAYFEYSLGNHKGGTGND